MSPQKKKNSTFNDYVVEVALITFVVISIYKFLLVNFIVVLAFSSFLYRTQIINTPFLYSNSENWTSIFFNFLYILGQQIRRISSIMEQEYKVKIAKRLKKKKKDGT